MSRFYFTLVSMAEPKYRDFSAALLPGVDNLLGTAENGGENRP